MFENIKKISVERCKMFDLLIRLGSMPALARHMRLPLHAIHNNINAIEKILDLQVLVRNKKKATLTEAGVRFAEFCQVVAEGADVLESQKLDVPDRLTIATYHGAGEYIMPDAIKLFAEAFPDVEIRLLCGHEFIDFDNPELDVAIAHMIYNRLDLVHTLLDHDEFNLYATPEYIEKHGMPKKWEDLKDHKLLTFKGTQLEPREIFETITPYMESNSYAFLFKTALNGIGICPISKFMLNVNKTNAKRLVLVPLSSTCLTRPFSFVTRRVSRKSVLTNKLLEVIKEIVINVSN